jgi:hypothetical protein
VTLWSPVGAPVKGFEGSANVILDVAPTAVGNIAVLCGQISASVAPESGIVGGGVTTWNQLYMTTVEFASHPNAAFSQSVAGYLYWGVIDADGPTTCEFVTASQEGFAIYQEFSPPSGATFVNATALARSGSEDTPYAALFDAPAAFGGNLPAITPSQLADLYLGVVVANNNGAFSGSTPGFTYVNELPLLFVYQCNPALASLAPDWACTGSTPWSAAAGLLLGAPRPLTTQVVMMP